MSLKPLPVVGLLIAALGTPLPGAAATPRTAMPPVVSTPFSAALPVTPSIPTSPPSCKVPISPDSWAAPRPNFPGFAYSQAMRKAAAAGLVWDVATLERYLADPDSVVAGTAMSVPPVRDEQERADLVAYLARSGPYQP